MSWFPRTIANILFPRSRNYFDVAAAPGVRGYCALTVDDCFCRQNDPSKSMMDEVRTLFDSYSAKGTFFVTLNYSRGAWRERGIRRYVMDGHELANHCKDDREYHRDRRGLFESDFVETDKFIRRMSKTRKVPFFRAPSGKCSGTMFSVLERRGVQHVMLDAYGNDPHIPDARFVADNILRSVTHGSIIVMHFPERGFREWTFEAMRLVLDGLKRKGLRSVTLSELHKHAGVSV